MYSERFIEELKSKILLSDVISKKVNIITKGNSKTALCPFHHEKTPSFHIDDVKGFYHCFGCGVSGDVIKFVMETEGLSFKEAIEKLTEDYSIKLPVLNNSKISKELENEYDICYKINEESCKFFEKNIWEPSGKAALNYVSKRGLKKEDIKFFRIGFSLNSFSALITHLKLLNFKEKDIEKAGFIVPGNNGYYDKFRNRVMFPVFDKKGRVIAFTGRVLDDAIPKYMNSPETILYHKSDILFNYFQARKYIYEKDCAILVEGNFDAISLFINKIENVVAPMGTATTLKQIEELWKCCNKIYVCFDGDEAGQKAMVRVSNMVLPILTPQKVMKFIILPKKEDPDSYIKSFGKKGFASYVKNNSYLLSEFLFDNALKKINHFNNNVVDELTPEESGLLEVALLEIVKNINNEIVKKNFLRFFRKKLWELSKFKKSNILSKYKQFTEIKFNKILPKKGTIGEIDNSIVLCEKSMLNLIIDNPDIVDELFKNFNVDIFGFDFSCDEINSIKSILFDFYEKDKLNCKEEILNKLKEEGFIDFLFDKFRIAYNNDGKALKELYILVLEWNELHLIKEIKQLVITNNDNSRRIELEKELEEIVKKKDKFKINSNNI